MMPVARLRTELRSRTTRDELFANSRPALIHAAPRVRGLAAIIQNTTNRAEDLHDPRRTYLSTSPTTRSDNVGPGDYIANIGGERPIPRMAGRNDQ